MKKRTIYFVIVCLFIGFFAAFLIYSGVWNRLKTGVGMIPTWHFFLMPIYMFYVTLIAHELGHLLSFVVQGIKIRALYITCFVFYRTKKGIRFKIKPALFKLLGGMVVPDLPVIIDEKTYHQTVKKFSKALMAGPLATLMFLGLHFLLMVLFLFFTKYNHLSAILTMTFLYTLFFSAIYLLSSSVNNEQFYGDFVAYKKMKTDEVFQFVQIHQYLMFSLKDQKDSYQFLFTINERLCQNNAFGYQLIRLMLFDNYIRYFNDHETVKDMSIDHALSGVSISYLSSNEGFYDFLMQLIIYYYQADNVDKAYRSIETLQKIYDQGNHPDLEDVISVLSYCLNIKDELDNRAAIASKFVDPQGWIFDMLLDDDNIEFRQYPLKQYETPIICYLDNGE